MGKLTSLLFGAAAGAGLMYFLDPDKGEDRKNKIRAAVKDTRLDASNSMDVAVRDLRHRVKGILAEGVAMVSDDVLDDGALEQRIRSSLSGLAAHTGALSVSVKNGQVSLDGDMLAAEMEDFFKGLRKIRGVRGIEHKIRSHEEHDGILQLQGEGNVTQASASWTPSKRLLTGAGAGYMLVYGMARGGLLGTAAQLGGLVLGVRAIANQNVKSLAGMGDNPHTIRVQKGILIDAPVEEVFKLWSNFENFPKFMSHVEKITSKGDKSHWVVKGPAGTPVEFDGITTALVDNQRIAWQTVDDAIVQHRGRVTFSPAMDGKATHVNVSMSYAPPAGVVGHTVASLFGVDPKTSMDEDLGRMKALLEKGAVRAEGEKVAKEALIGEEKNATRSDSSASDSSARREKAPQAASERQTNAADSAKSTPKASANPSTSSTSSKPTNSA